MKHTVYKLGRFLFCALAGEEQAAFAGPRAAEAAAEIRKPALFFKKQSSGYLLVTDSTKDTSIDPQALERLLAVARDTGAGIVYSDFSDIRDDQVCAHPLNDYQAGSIRDDFNFGYLFLISGAAIGRAVQKYGPPPNDESGAVYDLRLKISIDHDIIHIPELLYAAAAKKQNPAGKPAAKAEAHFDYVARENAARQKKLEKVATNYLKAIGAHLPSRTGIVARADDAQWKASIVIPVLNRKKTIADALKSALGQKTDFPFNILVVDNHSTDGTTAMIKKFTAKYPHIHHIIPSRRDLGIGGCWNEAVSSPACGRFVVQLDSDDLYSSPQTLQKIVTALQKGSYAMVVGSYTLVNERLEPIAPGLIDHREWTRENGHNNLLRINGMGAPRAFDAEVIRRIGFPNVSYGEDYAVALRLTREYKIGRIYESLYLCRRWSDNTDAGLSVGKQNRNDYYKDKLRTLEIQSRKLTNSNSVECRTLRAVLTIPAQKTERPDQIFALFPNRNHPALAPLCDDLFVSQKLNWPQLAAACRDLARAREKTLSCDHYRVLLQFNPGRALSSGAVVDAESIKKRPCFLCAGSLPAGQSGILYRNDFLILCNPAPIFHHHFTIVSRRHVQQEIEPSLPALLQLAADSAPDYTAFYNGPACGASAPDHLHFQMIPADALPYLNKLKNLPLRGETDGVRCGVDADADRAAVVFSSANSGALIKQFLNLFQAAKKVLATPDEPLMNILCGYEKDRWQMMIFLRRKHRPDAFYAKGNKRVFISPGAVDMAGVIVTPQLMDFERLDCRGVQSLYREVSLDNETVDQIVKKAFK